ncbi:MAG: IPT/TIG domain-containing protein [Candidatus Korobacteraceae bacterium]
MSKSGSLVIGWQIFLRILTLAVIAVVFGVGYPLAAQNPTIASIVPSPASPGDTVTITGTGFGDKQAGSSVMFGPAAASVTDWTDTSIKATVPGVTEGSYNVVVTVAGKGSSSLPVSVTAPISIFVSPGFIRPANGKLPSSGSLTVNCLSGSPVSDFSKDTLIIDGFGLTLSAKPSAAGTCSITYGLTIDPNTNVGDHNVALVDPTGKTLATALFKVVDAGAGSIPPGLAPEVDAFYTVMTQDNCSDVFGKRVAQSEYCIQLVVGNNSGYPLQIAGIGFSRQLKNLLPRAATANTSYASTRAILLRQQVTGGRNILYNSVQAAGVLMASATPFFGTGVRYGKNGVATTNNARTNWSTITSIVAGPLLSAFNIVAPNPVIAELNNLDDQTFRDGGIIGNNTPMRTTVFVDKAQLTNALTNLPVGSNEEGALDETIKNSRNPDTKFFIWPGKGEFDPTLVKRALGEVVIVGDEIRYVQRIQVQSGATPPAASAPAISGIVPPLATVGTSVTMSGSNFGTAQASTSTVVFGSTPAAAASVWSDTSITVLVPSTVPTGPANVVVSVGGTSSSPASFTVCPSSGPCQLTLDLPTTVTAGTAQTVTITVKDVNGVLKTFAGQVSLQSSDTTAKVSVSGGAAVSFPTTYQFTAATDPGTHKISVTFNAKGAQTLTVSAGTVTVTASTTVQ